jgi:hypothetical protein
MLRSRSSACSQRPCCEAEAAAAAAAELAPAPESKTHVDTNYMHATYPPGGESPVSRGSGASEVARHRRGPSMEGTRRANSLEGRPSMARRQGLTLVQLRAQLEKFQDTFMS